MRSMVGLIPLFAVEVLERRSDRRAAGLPEAHEVVPREPAGSGARTIAYLEREPTGTSHRLLAIPSRERLERVLGYVLDETEFLSPYGIRSLSRVHREHPYVLRVDGQELPGRLRRRASRRPACSAATRTGAGRSGSRQLPADRGARALPPLLRRRRCKVECPTGSGSWMNLRRGRARSSSAGCARCSCPDADGARPCHGGDRALRARIRTGRTSCCSTSTSTATTAAGSAPATRPAGRRSRRT